VCRPKALNPIVRLAARGEDKTARDVLEPQKRVVVFNASTPGVGDYTDQACLCLKHLAVRPQLHFLLHNAGAVEVLIRRVQDKCHTSAIAREAALIALLRLAIPAEPQGHPGVEASLRLEAGVRQRSPQNVSEMQTILLGCGALEAAVEALCTAKEEQTKVAAAELAATLAEVVNSEEQERMILSMKRPLIILKEEIATCERTRNVVDAALHIVTGCEGAVASAWTRNQHGQMVVTGAYPTAAVGDVDRLD